MSLSYQTDLDSSVPVWLVDYNAPNRDINVLNLYSIAHLISTGNYRGTSEISFDTLEDSFDVNAIITAGSIIKSLHSLPDILPSHVPKDIDFAIIYSLKPGEIKKEKEEQIRNAVAELSEFYFGIELHCRLYEIVELKETIQHYATSFDARNSLYRKIQEADNYKLAVEENPIIYALAWFLSVEEISPLPHFKHFEIIDDSHKKYVESLRLSMINK
jgi:hypothetical protein